VAELHPDHRQLLLEENHPKYRRQPLGRREELDTHWKPSPWSRARCHPALRTLGMLLFTHLSPSTGSWQREMLPSGTFETKKMKMQLQREALLPLTESCEVPSLSQAIYCGVLGLVTSLAGDAQEGPGRGCPWAWVMETGFRCELHGLAQSLQLSLAQYHWH
jgi:hypothetical protein